MPPSSLAQCGGTLVKRLVRKTRLCAESLDPPLIVVLVFIVSKETALYLISVSKVFPSLKYLKCLYQPTSTLVIGSFLYSSHW